jgi:hypothetical protein
VFTHNAVFFRPVAAPQLSQMDSYTAYSSVQVCYLYYALCNSQCRTHCLSICSSARLSVFPKADLIVVVQVCSLTQETMTNFEWIGVIEPLLHAWINFQFICQVNLFPGVSSEWIQTRCITDELLCLMLWLSTYGVASVLRYSISRRVDCVLSHSESSLYTTAQMLRYVGSPG